jgi:hypothetical protein
MPIIDKSTEPVLAVANQDPVAATRRRLLGGRRTIAAAVAVALIIAVGGGSLLWIRHLNQIEPYRVHLSGLKSYRLQNNTSNGGVMTFMAPAQLQNQPLQDNNAGQISLSLSKVTNKGHATGVAAVAGAVVNVVSPIWPSYLSILNTALTNDKVSYHAVYVQPLEQYVNDNFYLQASLDYTTPTKLTTPFIAKNAWQMDFTATYKKTGAHNTPFIVDGKLVFAVGKNNYYYLMLAAINYNWQSNQKIWQQAINSIKIDQ